METSKKPALVAIAVVAFLVLLPSYAANLTIFIKLVREHGNLLFQSPSASGLFSIEGTIRSVVGRLQWIVPILALAWFSREAIRDYGLRKITLKKLAADCGILVLVAIGALVAFGLCLAAFVSPDQIQSLKNLSQTKPVIGDSKIVLLPLILVALLLNSFVEEFIFRAYLYEKLLVFIKKPWVVVAACSILFGFGHLYEGAVGVAVTLALGLLFGWYYATRKSLWAIMLFHTAKNLIAVAIMVS